MYNPKHLRFLTTLMEALGETPWTYGFKESNPTSATNGLRRQLADDDMKVSKAKHIVDVLGYRLQIVLADKQTEDERQMQADKDTVIRLPKELTAPKPQQKETNLDFLTHFMKRMRLSRRQLAADIGITAGAVNTWFISDDIKVSYLYKIKETYGLRLEFNILPKDIDQ